VHLLGAAGAHKLAGAGGRPPRGATAPRSHIRLEKSRASHGVKWRAGTVIKWPQKQAWLMYLPTARAAIPERRHRRAARNTSGQTRNTHDCGFSSTLNWAPQLSPSDSRVDQGFQASATPGFCDAASTTGCWRKNAARGCRRRDPRRRPPSSHFCPPSPFVTGPPRVQEHGCAMRRARAGRGLRASSGPPTAMVATSNMCRAR